jgi:hypothetical protein
MAQGFGTGVVSVVSWLADEALRHKRWKWKPKAMHGDEEEEEDEDDDDSAASPGVCSSCRIVFTTAGLVADACDWILLSAADRESKVKSGWYTIAGGPDSEVDEVSFETMLL